MSNPTYPYGKQWIEQDDIDAVVSVLKSDWLTQGPNVKNFEDALAGKLDCGFVSAVSNGTVGLDLIGHALRWTKGDIVLTTPITFLASANCIIYNGATPDFVDIHPRTYTLDPQKLEEKILAYKQQNKKVKAVVAVDFAGQPCHWEELRQLAEKYDFQLVNDQCHAIGAKYKGDAGYATRFADIANLSFHPVKHITTGEGGAVTTNHQKYDEKIKLLRSHGMTKDENLLEKNDGPWYYEMIELGYNARITDMQCALGLTQLSKLDKFISRRREIAREYDAAFKNNELITIPYEAENVEHAYHLYPLQIDFKKAGKSRKDVFNALKERNIICQIHYIPVHLQPYYRKNFGFKTGDFPVAEAFYEQELSIPMYPLLKTEDTGYIAAAVQEVLQ